MNSKFLSWSGYDFIKGGITAALTSVVTALSQQLNVGHVPTWPDVKVIIISGAAAFLAYMAKNFFTNSDGKVAASEQKSQAETPTKN